VPKISPIGSLEQRAASSILLGNLCESAENKSIDHQVGAFVSNLETISLWLLLMWAPSLALGVYLLWPALPKAD
jgi:hypothetical protein